MNSLQITPLQDGLCHVCQTRAATHIYTFPQVRGFGSAFDGLTITFGCCEKCNREKYKTWFSEVPTVIDDYETYRHETALYNFLESLPVNSQEKIFNAGCDYAIDAQDWIDMHLGEMTDEQKTKYGLDDELFDYEFEV